MTQIDLDHLDFLDVSGEYDPAVGNIFGDAWRATKKIIKSPVTKVIVGATAVVFPPVGVPATAALIVADRVVRATDSKDPKKAAAAKATIKATATLAAKGDTHAQAAMKSFDVAKSLQGVVKDPTVLAKMVTPVAKANASAAGTAAAAAAKARAAAPKAVAKNAAPAGWTRSTEGSYKRAS